MKVIRFLIVSAALTATCVVALGVWVWHDAHNAVGHASSATPLEVARGERLEEVLSTLQQRGVIAHPLALKLYMKVERLHPIVEAGTYYFPSPISPIAVLSKLQQGPQFDRVTLIEGWNRWDIAEALKRVPALHLASTDAALSLLDDPASIKNLDPRAASLEGYLFPDTYFLVPDSSAVEVVSNMVQRFKQVWHSQLEKKAQARGMSAHDTVVRASIIETEAKLDPERPIIASVIENRLKRHMPLSMDSTIVYASKMAGAWHNDGKVYQSDIDRPSPYNTRKNLGLPPGPVACPGLSSLQAAVNPARTDYLFYVRNPARMDGAHSFYNNETSFATGVQALRDWEQKQGRK